MEVDSNLEFAPLIQTSRKARQTSLGLAGVNINVVQLPTIAVSNLAVELPVFIVITVVAIVN